MRFKLGDRVVRINTDLLGEEIPVGAVGVVLQLSPGFDYYVVRWECGKEVGSYPKNLQLESIYNSPLEQALR